MEKIAILYAPAGGSTEKVANKIAMYIEETDVKVVLVDEKTEVSFLNEFEKVIMGISTVGRDTWDGDYGKTGWDFFLPKLEVANFSGKTVAVFGLGDHILYPQRFVDALGILAKTVRKTGATLIGQCEIEKFPEFQDIESEGIEGKSFLGLPLDEDQLADKTDQRIKDWLQEIL